jgi:hypothetical protein
MMIKNYQARRKLQTERPQRERLAFIAGVFDDGVTLRFSDGSTSKKHYKFSSGIAPTLGAKAHLIWCGTYVVDYLI